MVFNQEEWIHLGQWVQSPLSACFWDNWTQNNEKYPFKIDQMDGGFPFLYGHSFVRKSDLKVLKKFIKENINNFELLKVMERWVDDVHKSSKDKISIEFNSLYQAMSHMKWACNDIVNPWIFFLTLDSVIEEEIQEICNKKEYNFDEIIQLIKPIKKSFTVLQSEEAMVLHNQMKEEGIASNFSNIEKVNPALAQEIKEHVDKFEFVGAHHFVGEPYTIKRFLESKPTKIVEETTKNNPKELE